MRYYQSVPLLTIFFQNKKQIDLYLPTYSFIEWECGENMHTHTLTHTHTYTQINTHTRQNLCPQYFHIFVHEINNFISTVTVTTTFKYEFECLPINLRLALTRDFMWMKSDSILNQLFDKQI